MATRDKDFHNSNHNRQGPGADSGFQHFFTLFFWADDVTEGLRRGYQVEGQFWESLLRRHPS
jgi:hypothetical protein